MAFKDTKVDMINGPVAGKIIIYTIPIILSSLLQLLYNAADIVVLGRFSSQEALAAVGTTGSLINLILNVFLGLGVGVNVVAAQYYGTKDREGMSRVTHTAVAVGLLCGIGIGLFGFFCCGIFLRLMSTPEDIIEYSILYMKIYFCGIPASLLYNFGSAILRSIGETRKPLYFLAGSGLINVLLNLFFVIVLKMSIDGVALATIISQYISAGLVIWYLMQIDDSCRISIKKIRIHASELWKMCRYGLPAGIQGTVFSISNVLIQSSINSFGSIVVAGNTAAGNLEGFVYVSMNAFHFSALSFTGQNVGAWKPERFRKISLSCIFMVSVVGLLAGISVWFFGKPLLEIYLPKDPEAVRFGCERLLYVCAPYVLCGIMDTAVGVLRGMGASLSPMLMTIIGVCGIRIIWILTIFNTYRSLPLLYISYPISWTVTAIAQIITIQIFRKKLIHRHQLNQKVSV